MNLQAYKFETKVLENGTIQIPDFKYLINQEIEVFIILKSYPKKKEGLTADDFLKKWSGFLTLTNTDDAKYQYLNEKYQ